MPSKVQLYAQMADRTAEQITGSYQKWTAFLTTAARLYKYPYNEQLMIFAQRPEATACAEYDLWNKQMRRYVRRGSKGIALVDTSSDQPKLRYVFDVSDTSGGENSRRPYLWEYRQEHREVVSAALEQRFDVSGENGLADQMERVAAQLVDEYWHDNWRDIVGIVDGSFLEGYDDFNIGAAFRNAAVVSTTYALLSRCGMQPGDYFEHEDFLNVFDFNTPQTVAALGTAISQSSELVLRQIEITIKNYEREKLAERSHSHDRTDLHQERGLPDSRPDAERNAGGRETPGQVRETAQELSSGAQTGAVQPSGAVGEAVPASAGDRRDGEPEAGADDAGAVEVGGRDGGAESPRPDEMGGADEQPESAGGGNDPDRADLQLNFLEAAVPTEAQQIESIDQAESEKSSSAFVLSQADIEKALRRGSNFENSKLRIWEIYQTQPDRKLRAKALAKEYAPHGPGGCSHTYLDGSSGWLDHDSKGLTFEHYPDHQKIFLRWNQVEKYIDLMMQADRYLTDKEKSAIELYFELNADSAAEYNALKEQYPDALVGFEQNGQFEFYGEDARKICELTGGKLLERETALGTVLVTGFPREQWVYRAKQLWECGENIYLAGLNEDGMHHQTKYLRREEYLPVGSIVHMEGREFRVDKVDFDKDSVTLQDMALAELRMPIFREAPLAVVRELYEQEPEPPVLVSDGLGLPGEDSNKLPVSIEVNEVPTTPEAAAAEEGLNEEGAPELAGNFRITDEELGAGGPKQKFARNIKAIKTLFTLEQEHRGATAEEQQVLSQYVGWGGLADAFDPDKNSWAKEYAELKGLLSEEEYKAARGSVLNAHYTSPTVIRAIYDAVERMGFRTGNILEPSMGVGNFFGMLPESMADSRLYGVELDSITGRIAQKLYPEANIKVAGFETTDRRDFYDLVVGNVPFGNYKVNDKAYNKLNFSIHNYFFAKAIDQVRPGGIVAFVTSRYTLDSKDSAARKHIAERADLLGAIRLPNNAFRANAGTDVVSDIIFLQKRDRPMDHEPAWVQLGKTADGIAINSYFADHPEMILGELTTESTQYGKEEATVVPIEGANLADQLREAVRQLEGQYLEAAAEVPDIAETEAERRTLPADPDVKNFSYPQGAGSAHRDRGGAGERTD